MTNRRIAILATSLVVCLGLTGWDWPQWRKPVWPPTFELSWDEEVQLRDGRVIVVNLKFTYERLNRNSQYERSILRNTEMSFDAGPPHGRVTQLFRRQQPVMLDHKDGKWYAALAQRGNINLIRDEDWGPFQTSSGLRVGLLRSTKFEPIPIDFMPVEFDRPNFDYHYGPFDEILHLDGQRLTLVAKRAREMRYPLGPEHRTFTRPNPSVYQQMQSKEMTK